MYKVPVYNAGIKVPACPDAVSLPFLRSSRPGRSAARSSFQSCLLEKVRKAPRLSYIVYYIIITCTLVQFIEPPHIHHLVYSGIRPIAIHPAAYRGQGYSRGFVIKHLTCSSFTYDDIRPDALHPFPHRNQQAEKLIEHKKTARCFAMFAASS